MAGAGVEVKGLAQLHVRLLKIDVGLNRGLRQVHERIAAIVAHTAQPIAPRRTGRLASTQGYRASAHTSTVFAGGPEAPYAPPLHWGWYRRGIPASRWMIKAAKGTESSWLPLYEAAIDKLCD